MDQPTEVMPVRIVIVDNHPVMVRGLSEFLEDELGFHVVGVAENRNGFLEILFTEQADIALVDLRLDDGSQDAPPSGIELIKEAQKLAPQIRCIVYSVYREYGQAAIDAGAWAYILKDTPMDRLVEVIRDVLDNKYVYPPDVMSYLRHKSSDTKNQGKSLTEREKQILCEWVLHPQDTRAAIALKLSITEGAVRTHLRNIYQKLDVHSRAEAIIKAQELEYDK